MVTPTLNQGSFLAQTLASILPQLTPADAFVVVDGGSTDSTGDILERYRARISTIIEYPGSSHAQALARGFSLHRREYCCYVNSDDLLLPGALAKARDLLDSRRAVTCLYSHRVFIDADNRVTGIWRLPRHSDYLMRRWDYIPQETAVWRTDAMVKAGGIDPSLAFAVDYDLFLKLMRDGTLRRVNDYLGAFRVHARSKTSTQNESIGQPEVAELKRRHAVRGHLPDRLLGALLRLTIAATARATLSAGLRARLQGLVDQAAGQTDAGSPAA